MACARRASHRAGEGPGREGPALALVRAGVRGGASRARRGRPARRPAQPQHPEGRRRQWEAAQAWDAYDRLPELRVPVLVLHGSEDQLIDVGNARQLASRILAPSSRPRGRRPRLPLGAGGARRRDRARLRAEAPRMSDVPDEVDALVQERQRARVARDFARADALSATGSPRWASAWSTSPGVQRSSRSRPPRRRGPRQRRGERPRRAGDGRRERPLGGRGLAGGRGPRARWPARQRGRASSSTSSPT